MLSIPQPWDQQPQEVVPVLWPVPAQLVFNPGAGYHDHGTANATVTPVGAAAILPWNGELSAKVGSSAGADRVEFGSPPALNSQAFSGLIRFYQTTASQAFLIETGGAACFEVVVSGTSVAINRSNVTVVITSSNAPVLNAWNIVSFSVNRATSRHRIALNGILTTGSAVVGTFNNFGTVQTGKWSGALGQLHYTSCLILANQEVFDDAFLTRVSRSAQEVWGLFTPRSIWLPVSSASSGTSFTITPSGGITFGGTSVDVKGKILEVSGGVTFSGTGNASFASGGTTYTITPSGGLVFAGVGTSVNSKVFLPSGGITFGGSGLDLRTKIIDIAGGVSFGGTGSMSSNTSIGAAQTGERTKVGVGT